MATNTFDLTQLNNLYSQIDQLSGYSIGSTEFGKGMSSYNEIAWFGNAVNSLGSEEASAEQKAATVNQLVQKALSLFEKFANKEAKVAQQEVATQTKQTEDLLKKSQDLNMKLEGEFSDISSSIDAETAIVTEATEMIAETQKSLEEKQEEVNKLVSKIEEEQAKLAATNDPQEQAEILANIQGIATEISNIRVSIEAENEQLQNLTAAVEDTTKDIESATERMGVVEQDGIAQLQQLSQEEVQALTEVTTTSTTGATNEATGAAAEAAANAASTNIITGSSVAPKLHQLAQDQNAAGSTRLSSIAGNINRISQGIGTLSNNTQIIASFQTSVGGALDNYATQLGSWNTAVQPVITSLGSFANVAIGVEELNQSVESDLGVLGANADSATTNSTTDANTTSTAPNNTEQGSSTIAPEQNTELLTPKFDIKKLQQFGV